MHPYFWGGAIALIRELNLLLVLGDRILNDLSTDISEIRLGVDGSKNNSVTSFEVVDNSIASTITFLNTAIFKPDFEDGVDYSRDAIAREFACLKLLN